MADLATIRIPVDSSDMVQAVREAKNLERGIKMLVDALGSGAIGANQYNAGLRQLQKEFKNLFGNYQQATAAVSGHAKSLQESAVAAKQAASAKNDLAMATKKAETAFALANQKAKEELQTLRNRAEFAFAIAMQREQESQKAVQAAERQAQAEAKLTAEILRRRQTQEASASSNAAAYQAQIGQNLGLGARGISAAASASAMEAEIERLRQKYDQVYAASQLYETSLKELNQAHMLGITSIKQHEAAVESLNAEYQAFQDGSATATNRFAQSAAAMSGGLNNVGVLMQQLGYQAGDFIVQVQSGTNAFVAFGQQATQLVGFLPMLAAELNIAKVAFMGLSIPIAPLMLGLSILIPALTAVGAYFSRTASESDSASEALKSYGQVLNNLNSSLDQTNLRLEALRRGLSPDEILTATLAIEDLQNQFDTLRSTEVSGFWDTFTRGDRMAALTAMRLEMESTLETLKEQAAEEQRLETAQKRRANEFRNELRESRRSAEGLRDELMRIAQAMVDIASINISRSFRVAQSAANDLLNSVSAIINRMQRMATIAAAISANVAQRVGDTDRGGQREQRRSAAEYRSEQIMKRLETSSGSASRSVGKVKEVVDEAAEAAEDFAKAMDSYVVRGIDGVSNAWAEFVVRGFRDFKGFVDAVLDSFKNMLVQMIALAAKNRIMIGLGLSPVGEATAGVAQAGVGGLLRGGVGSTVGGLWSGIKGVFTGGGLGSSFANLGGLLTGSVGGLGAIGAAIPALGVIGAAFSFFRTKVKELDNGLRVTANGVDTFVESFQTIQKSRFWGLKKSTSTSVSGADPYIESMFSGISKSVINMAKYLGYGEEAFENFTKSVSISLKGLTDEQKLAKIQSAVAQYGDALAGEIGYTFNSLVQSVISQRQHEASKRQAKRLMDVATGRDTNSLSSQQLRGMPFFERVRFTVDSLTVLYNRTFLKEIEDQGKRFANSLSDLKGLNEKFKFGRIKLQEFLALADDFAKDIKTEFEDFSFTVVRVATDIGLAAGGFSFTNDQIKEMTKQLDPQKRVEAARAIGAEIMGQAFSEGQGGISEAVTNVYNFFGDFNEFVSGPIAKAMDLLRDNFQTLQSSLSELRETERLASDAIKMAKESGIEVTKDQLDYYKSLTQNISSVEELSKAASAELKRLQEISKIIPEQAAALEGAILENLSGGEVSAGALVDYVAQYGKSLGKQIAYALTNAANAGIEGVLSAFGQFSSLYSSGAIVERDYRTLTNKLKSIVLGGSSARSSSGDGGGSVIDSAVDSFKELNDTIVDAVKSLRELNKEQVGVNRTREKEFEYLRSINRQNALADPERFKDAIKMVSDIDQNLFATQVDYMREVNKTAGFLENLSRQLGDSVPAFANGGVHSGGVRLVGEKGPELEVTGPSRIFNAEDTRKMLSPDTSDLRREISQMRTDLYRGLVQIAKNTRKSAETLNKFDYDGMPDNRGF